MFLSSSTKGGRKVSYRVLLTRSGVMKEDRESNRFQGWPFHAEERREDGEINNGAFDLISQPHKIDSIHEATDANGLRPLIKYLNRPVGCFMTLGCAAGIEDDGLYYSYLELTIRYAELARSTDWPQEFEQKWKHFLERAESQIEGIRHLLEESCRMTYRHFYLRPEIDRRLLVCMDLRAVSEAHHRILISHAQRFFELLESGELN